MLKVYRDLFSYVPKQKNLAYLAIFIAALSSFFSVGAFYFLYRFFSELIVSKNAESSYYYAGLIIVMMLAGAFFYFSSGLISHFVAFRLETNLRKRGIDGLKNSNFSYFNNNTSGKIRKIIDDNAAETHAIVAHLIPDTAAMIVTPLLIIAMAFAINIYIGLALLLLIAIGALQIKNMMGEAVFMDRYTKALENMNSETIEYVRGMQVIKIFKTSVESFKALYHAIKDYSDQALNYSFSCRQAYVIFQVLFISYIILIIPVFWLVIPSNQQINYLPQLLFLFSVIGLLFNTFMRVMYVSMYQYKGAIAIEKIETLYKEMTENRAAQGTEEYFNNGDIEFKNVSFAYDEHHVIDDLSFKLDGNKVYAFVGSSGSGKSTIAKLISGFYKANKGQILIGQKPIEDYSQNSLMKEISFVFQQSKLFKLSLFENVKIGNPDASYEQVMQALELASCQEILDKFPEREETIIGSKGVHLSGGEQQRIAIARAILKDAKIIILDEASASTDVNNEYHIQKAFANLMLNKTVIIIAHRLPSIKGVDEILVIDKGTVIERGNDEELSKKIGKYQHFKKLYAATSEWRVS